MIKIIRVQPLANYKLKVYFNNNEIKIFDTAPYLSVGIFQQLKDENYFNQVSVKWDSIAWPDGQDFSPDTVYMRSTLVKAAAPALID